MRRKNVLRYRQKQKKNNNKNKQKKYVKLNITNKLLTKTPNRRNKLNRCQFDVDITSIHKKNKKKLPMNFFVFSHTLSMSFLGWTIDVDWSYIVRCYFDGGEINIVSTDFVQYYFRRQKIEAIFTNFFLCNWNVRKIGVVLKSFSKQFWLTESWSNFDVFIWCVLESQKIAVLIFHSDKFLIPN